MTLTKEQLDELATSSPHFSDCASEKMGNGHRACDCDAPALIEAARLSLYLPVPIGDLLAIELERDALKAKLAAVEKVVENYRELVVGGEPVHGTDALDFLDEYDKAVR